MPASSYSLFIDREFPLAVLALLYTGKWMAPRQALLSGYNGCLINNGQEPIKKREWVVVIYTIYHSSIVCKQYPKCSTMPVGLHIPQQLLYLWNFKLFSKFIHYFL